MEVASKLLIVRTDGGQLWAWFPPAMFPNFHSSNVTQSWNHTFQNRWPINLLLIAELNSSFQGISTDGTQVN